MRLVSLPTDTKFRFMKFWKLGFVLSSALSVASVILFFVVGLNYGIDFEGGTLVEIQTKDGPANIGELRQEIGQLNLGDVQIQEFGSPNDVLIRVVRQPGGEQEQQRAIQLMRDMFQDRVEFRRVEVVGPVVSSELAQAGLIAVVSALLAIMIYIWFRFEWHFAVGAVVTTVHDVLITIGMFAVVGLEFNLTSIAAVLTIVGYSLNDTVVVYDRVRENLRRYKKMPMAELIDLSINQMISRTIMTSVTTLIALIALFIFGGEVIRSFTFAMIWGILIGTYSSIFIAAPMLIMFKLRPDDSADDAEEAAPAGAS
ncbi:protein translocase subunit SecF [Amorphus orientalis]|uniref:Protein-export membrane protein SecF n=1 Tax=Amorphus orientalis TaxID=649198 RepID=A0AAE4AUG7_9HYPH|nr:protein translocase subunit SecF [Amorphus orientalis]MDQ0315824.1 preprotein translocase SecF subunit [Amorphus orientalis]